MSEEKDFQAQMDMETLKRAKQIEDSPGRLGNIRRFADQQKRDAALLTGDKPGVPINGAVRGRSVQRQT